MMKLNVFLVACIVMYCVCVAVADDSGCTINGKVLKKGETYQTEGACEELTCAGSDTITGKTCPLINFDPTKQKCTVVPEDVSKPYPTCCETLTCED